VAALTQIARLESNRESRKTIRHSSGDGIAAENFYQHAEHYFRVDNERRENNQQGTPPRPITPVDVEINSEADSREVNVGRFQPQWDGEDSVSSETSTH
jgi:hypothetical protein